MCSALSHRNVTKIHMKLKQSMVELCAKGQEKLDSGLRQMVISILALPLTSL